MSPSEHVVCGAVWHVCALHIQAMQLVAQQGLHPPALRELLLGTQSKKQDNDAGLGDWVPRKLNDPSMGWGLCIMKLLEGVLNHDIFC